MQQRWQWWGGVALAAAIAAAFLVSCTRREVPRPPGDSSAAYGECRILDPFVDGNLAVYPVTRCSAPAGDYLTLDEAMQAGVLAVSEAGSAGQGQSQAQVESPAAPPQRQVAAPPRRDRADRAQRIVQVSTLNGSPGATVNTWPARTLNSFGRFASVLWRTTATCRA